jgi:hypothetical protein
MVQRGFRGVNSLSTSQALSRVVEVAQGVFLRTMFVLDLGNGRFRAIGFALRVIGMVLSAL